MIAATRKWLQRNRTPFAIAVGVLGVGYVATTYVLGKISDARQRMSTDRIARENLKRRFEQNQEDCTFTVLALLPTATDNILSELETERITFELQQQKALKLARNGEVPPSELGSQPPSVTDDDGRSMASLQSENGIHVSQLTVPSPGVAGEGAQGGGQQVQKAKKSKLQLWNDLKISAITRAFTLIYTLALLTLLTRIQLNLLGRRSYLSSVVSLATAGLEPTTISMENNDDDNVDQTYGNDFETNRRYLTFSWWLLHKGWRQVMLKVDEAVREAFGSMSPREDVSMQKFAELTLEVRMKVEGATEEARQSHKWLDHLLPNKGDEEFVLKESGMTSGETPTGSSSVDQPLRRLLDETSDLIDAPQFAHVLTKLLDSGFSTLVDQKIAQQVYKVAPEADNDVRVTEIIEPKPVKLPILLALVTRQAHSIGNGVPNEYLQAMEQIGDLEAFAAVVYSSNWENEISPMTPPDASYLEVQQNTETEMEKETETETELDLEPELTTITPKVELTPGQQSVVDVRTASSFEDAWGKAAEAAKEHRE
ncbi:Peroxin-3 [Calycina marina]|uniref:Peroxin-3 n=1 Tax=Calycina marina TaxID=1763456 RepID=A0A9P7Z7R5_9HELO|nr:Peroxin-3 [Calycina marina]